MNNSISMGCLLFGIAVLAGCQQRPSDTNGFAKSQNPSTSFIDQVVEASCGECQFGMDGAGCDLAVRVDGQAWFVDGAKIDDFGDAHGDDGMCSCIRQAMVSGEIRDGRLVATRFEVLPRADK